MASNGAHSFPVYTVGPGGPGGPGGRPTSTLVYFDALRPSRLKVHTLYHIKH